MISRNIAYKLWISNINNSNYVKSLGEFESSYIEFKNKKVTRVNLIAVAINKYETDNYSSIMIDDSSSQISVKSWNEDKKIADKISIGDVILLIGKIRQNSQSSGFYIQPEIMKKVDEKWLLARKYELENEYGKQETNIVKNEMKNEKMMIEEINVSNKSLRNKILNLIDKLDNDQGISKEELLKHTNSPLVFESVEELLKEGEIFEVNGRYKLLK